MRDSERDGGGMQNYLFRLEYDGSRYSGWQKLGNSKNTIQGKLEDVLLRMCGAPVQLIGAGRTDAGVHARGQAANAHFDTGLSEEEIRAYLNHYLPEDIRVLSVQKADARFHCRYHALQKHYSYTVCTGEKAPVFLRRYVYQLGQLPDLEKMREAARLLCGRHDFTSFCGNRHMKKSAVRTVFSIEISFDSGHELLRIDYKGDGFLQYMIRILTGTLLETGLGKRKPASMTALLSERDRALSGYTAPPCGLCLEDVTYGEAPDASKKRRPGGCTESLNIL